MGLRKCPKCELNYLKEGETLCNVCRRSMKHEDEPEEELICIECGEHPALKGKELCAECYKESLRQQKLQSQRQSSMDGIDFEDVDDVTLPDEEIPTGSLPDELAGEFGDELNDDLTKKSAEPEEGEIEFTKGLSLEAMEEEEAEEYDDEDSEYEDGETPVRKTHR